MYSGHNWNHLFYFAITYGLGLTTGLVIALNKMIKDKQKANQETLDKLEEVINSWKKRDN